MLRGVIFSSLVLLPSLLKAEPWLAIRFAQNCAGCHAPGRINLKPIDRRCTLSCQGCHVSPQGGGLRSFYGKWNENRLLRSFVVSYLQPSSSFAPVSKQHYGRRSSSTAKKKGKTTPAKQTNKMSKKKIIAQGYPLVQGKQQVITDERPYERDGLEYKIAKNKYEFLRQIPQEDPYRLFDASKIDGGADFRYQFFKTDAKDKKKSSIFLMSADIALRWRPVHRYVHFVFEHRSKGFPQTDKNPAELFKQTRKAFENSRFRSLYLLVDNLPYNIYVMAGYYRPLFGGNPIPDHTSLVQKIIADSLFTTSAYNLRYRAVSVGTAPNVPYANLHLILRDSSEGYDSNEKTRGVAGNVGLRFVTLGINATYSFWYTKSDKGNWLDKADTQRWTMLHSSSLGAQLYRSTVLLEYIRAEGKNLATDDAKKFSHNLIHLDTHTQLWRQFYLTAEYALTHTSANKSYAHQYRVGLRSFLLSGIDLSFKVERMQKSSATDNSKDKSNTTMSYSAQLHTYL